MNVHVHVYIICNLWGQNIAFFTHLVYIQNYGSMHGYIAQRSTIYWQADYVTIHMATTVLVVCTILYSVDEFD